MPTADLDAVFAVLPIWVRIGGWLLLPLLLLLPAMFGIWLCARCTRVVGEGKHWTELARERFTARVLLTIQIWLYIVIAAVLSVELDGLWTTGWESARVLLSSGLVWFVTRGIVYRHGFRTQLGWTRRDFRQSNLLLLSMFPGPAVAVAMAIDGPSVEALGVAGCCLFYGIGLLSVAWLILVGPLHIARSMGLVVPADDRLRGLVAAVEQRTGHSVRATWILRSRAANAFAVPWSNSLGVTSGALERMDDAELTAVLLHEFGHLRESRRSQLIRCAAVSPWLVLAVWQPVMATFGWVLADALLVVTVLLLSRIKRTLRRLELAADGHAHDHLGAAESSDYARALEHLHRINLIPAVLGSRNLTHPDLYDRMVAAGVTPAYQRPLPPPAGWAKSIAFCLLALVITLVVLLPALLVRRTLYESEAAAMFDVMLAGDHVSVGAIGYHWLEARPHDAAVLLAYSTSQSTAPEHPAWLAIALVASGDLRARVALEHAEKLLSGDHVEPWQRETVDTARQWVDQEPASEGR